MTHGGATDAPRSVDERFKTGEDLPESIKRGLANYLADHGMRLDTDAPARRFSGGLANLNYLVRIDGAPAVLRRPPPGPTAEGANDMAREWTVLSRLNAAFPVAPKGLHFCKDPEPIGAPFQLIEYREGIAIRDTLPKDAPADAGSSLTRSLVAAMAGLHALDPTKIGLGALGKPEGFLGRQVEGWLRRAAAVYPEGLPASVTAIAAHLRGAVPASARTSLLHSDLKFDNMLFTPGALAPVAVIDWDMATRGDPLFDLAVLLSYWIEPGDPAPLHALRQVPSLSPGFPDRRSVVELYFAASGRPAEDIGFHLVLARLRLAVAWMQLFRQFERGRPGRPPLRRVRAAGRRHPRLDGQLPGHAGPLNFKELP